MCGKIQVADLQAQLQLLGLPKSGLKEVLVQRLHAARPEPSTMAPEQPQSSAAGGGEDASQSVAVEMSPAHGKRRGLAPRQSTASIAEAAPSTPSGGGGPLEETALYEIEKKQGIASATKSYETGRQTGIHRSSSHEFPSSSRGVAALPPPPGLGRTEEPGSSGGATRRAVHGSDSSTRADGAEASRVKQALRAVLGIKPPSGSKRSSIGPALQNDDGPHREEDRSAVRFEREGDASGGILARQQYQQQKRASRVGSYIGAAVDPLRPRNTSTTAPSGQRGSSASHPSRWEDTAYFKQSEDEEFMVKLRRAMSSPPPTWEPRRDLGPAVAIPLAPGKHPGATSKPLTIPPLDRPRGLVSDKTGDSFSGLPRSGYPQARIDQC